MPLHEFGRSLSMTTAVKSKLQLPFFKLVWLYLYFIYISIDYIQWQRVWFLHDWIDLNVNPQSQCIHAQRFLFQNWEGKCWASYLFSKIYCIYSLGQFSGHISKLWLNHCIWLQQLDVGYFEIKPHFRWLKMNPFKNCRCKSQSQCINIGMTCRYQWRKLSGYDMRSPD